MRPDVVIEVRQGAVVGVYGDLPISAVIVDWDNLCEPDGESSFCLIDTNGQIQIGGVVPVPVEPPEHMPVETRQVVEFFTRSEGQPRAQ